MDSVERSRMPEPRAHGCAARLCQFCTLFHCRSDLFQTGTMSQSLATCMGAEVARYLSSGLATSTSVWARARHPCRSRSESKVPHTLCYVRNHSAMVSERRNPTPTSAIRCAYLSETTVFKLPTEPRGCGPCFRTVRDRKSSSRPHGRACGMS